MKFITMKATKFTLCILFFCCGALCASAQMTDKQISAYVGQALSAGKNKEAIAKELVAKGATTEQLSRLYNASGAAGNIQGESASSASDSLNTAGKRMRVTNAEVRQTITEIDADESRIEKKAQRRQKKNGEIPSEDVKEVKIYGHDIFRAKNLSFEPNVNTATPSNYILGPGDEVLVDVWGINEASLSLTVSPEGKVHIAQCGPVQLAGLTIRQATEKLRKALSQKYSLSGPDASSKMSVTLGKIRTIQVNVMGEVNTPGTYRLSSLSTVFNALYLSGGVTSIGSLRSVQIVRGGTIAATVDIYSYIFNGTAEGEMALCDGDAIIVPPYSALVEMCGGVKRPMHYEILPGEKLEKLIQYAGGFSFDAYDEEITVQRRDGKGGKAYTLHSDEFGAFAMADGDKVEAYVNGRINLFDNRVEVRGSISRPGYYALGGEIATVRQLVEHAGGLLEDAFTTRAQLIREKQDRSLEIQPVAIGAIMNGSAPDILLRKGDLLQIADKNEMEPKGNFTITGYVTSPGEYLFADNTTVEDLIMMAGGLVNGASTAKVEVSRRIYSPESLEANDTLAQIFFFGIKDGLVVDGQQDFILEPFDVVSIRKSPTFIEQKQVTVSGDVQFPGEYTMLTNNDRISDLYYRAGGAIKNAFIEGTTLKRKFSDAEKQARNRLALMAANETDSTNIRKITLTDTYNVGIDIVKALEDPHGPFDVVLCAGDELIIPSETSTVRIQGEVFYPNAVNFIEGKPVSYYIKQAGGFSNDAKRADVYVVYMNGHVDRGNAAPVEPGCEIVVPAKPARKKMTIGEIISIGTAAASLSTVIVTLINLVKK